MRSEPYVVISLATVVQRIADVETYSPGADHWLQGCTLYILVGIPAAQDYLALSVRIAVSISLIAVSMALMAAVRWPL